ncbi:response regulator transcription factor [Streptosporangiaceae bacterium NEAU-GS5]|nr:response regulator transcription factor [Streptosporangiaceae bacterium NEAU-GS5]
MTQELPPFKVLVVDDAVEITEILRDYLEAAGFDVRTAAAGAAALARLAAEPVDCVLLDVMMPGMSGFEVCRRIRQTSEVPVLFLTARDSDSDKLRGLGLADDYIVKTASSAEVVARVRTVLRRAARPAPRRVLDFGRLQLDLPAHEVRLDGRAVPVTAREFALLRLLAEHPRRVFPREELFERIWGAYGDQGTVWVHIRRLREKIGPGLITTVRGAGYRFEAP